MWQVDIENIAGIRAGGAELRRGVNVVQASNFQGKTSFLTALRTVVGAGIAPTVLTDGQSRGRVRLATDEGTYTAELSEDGDGVVRDGELYVTEPRDRVCAELFAVLDGRNEIRAAVREGRDLSDLLTRPLEQENIEERVADLESERRRVETELERAERVADERQAKVGERERLEAELSELRSELAELGTDDDADGSLREELDSVRRSHERAEQTVRRLERQVDSLEGTLEEKRAALEELDVPDAPDLGEELARKRDRLAELDEEIEALQTVYNANRQVLDRDQLDLVTEIERSLSGDRVTCWVCGDGTTPEAIDEQLAGLAAAISDRRNAAAGLREEVDDLETRHRHVEHQRSRRRELERELSTVRTRLEECRDDLASSRERQATLEDELEGLQQQLEATDDRRRELEETIARTEARIDTLDEEIDQLGGATRPETLRQRRDELDEEIEALRSRRERTIQRARDAFEAALEDVVERFGPSFEAARLDRHTDPGTGRTSGLELVIARDGREIPVDRLSEGEVELVGIIAALAGHEAFDVADAVPCILLDDVGGLASEHLHTLVRYLEQRADYVVTSAYPEAGEFDGHVVSPAGWSVVSDSEETTA